MSLGTPLLPTEGPREYFRDVEFVADRSFVGTIYFDKPNYWPTDLGPNSQRQYSFKLTPDLSQIESGKILAIDGNGDVVSYSIFHTKGTKIHEEGKVTDDGHKLTAEATYVLQEILPQKAVEEKSCDQSKAQVSKPVGPKSTSGKKSVPSSKDSDSSGVEGNVTISKTEYEELKEYKEKFFHLKGLLKIASSYCDNA